MLALIHALLLTAPLVPAAIAGPEQNPALVGVKCSGEGHSLEITWDAKTRTRPESVLIDGKPHKKMFVLSEHKGYSIYQGKEFKIVLSETNGIEKEFTEPVIIYDKKMKMRCSYKKKPPPEGPKANP